MIAPQKAQCPAATGQSAGEAINPPILPSAENLGKRETSLIAAFALRGVAVHRLAGGGYLACRWNLSKYCHDLPELTAFARQVGVV